MQLFETGAQILAEVYSQCPSMAAGQDLEITASLSLLNYAETIFLSRDGQISRIENGKERISFRHLKRISDFLKIDFEMLVQARHKITSRSSSVNFGSENTISISCGFHFGRRFRFSGSFRTFFAGFSRTNPQS